MNATPTKLRSGAWGARVDGTPEPGAIITVNTRSGRSWEAAVDQVVWTDGSTSVVSTRSVAEASTDAAPYALHGGSGYGCNGWEKGAIVRASERHRAEGWPEWLLVVAASREYVRDDGMSFGVGEDSGYRYSARCREATPEEYADAAAEYEREQQRRAAVADRDRLARTIIADGEYPRGIHTLDGDHILVANERNILYGGGSWFVIDGDWLWHIKNNGADGDAWDANNIRTGGAGAIGRRVPLTEELKSEIERLREVMG